MHLITEFSILSKRAVSVHCPLSFILFSTAKSRNVTVLSINSPVSYKWDESKLQTYQQNLRSNVCQSINNQLLSDIIYNNLNCDDISDHLYNMLNTVINGTFKVKGKKNILIPSSPQTNGSMMNVKI